MVSKTLLYVIVGIVVIGGLGYMTMGGDSSESTAAPTAEVDTTQGESTTESQASDSSDTAAQEESAATTGAYCTPGDTYVFEEEGGTSDTTIIGLETYKGKEFCKAESTTTIDSPAGEVVTESVYYFDESNSEFWVIATISSSLMPEPQVTETHIVDGKVMA